MMVRVPFCNIDRPIYIWRMEIKLKDTRTPLHICRHGLPSFILISKNLIVEQLKKEAFGTNWPVAAAGVVYPHASAQSDNQSPPRPTPLHLISYFSRYH